jgi:hypothetical protein
MNRLIERSWNFILGNFTHIATLSTEILQLDVDDLFSIINDELLNVKVKYILSLCINSALIFRFQF